MSLELGFQLRETSGIPSSKSTESRQPYTDTGSVLACAGAGTALLGFTLSWLRRLSPRPAAGFEHSLCFYPKRDEPSVSHERWSHHPIPRALIFTSNTGSPNSSSSLCSQRIQMMDKIAKTACALPGGPREA